MNSIDKPSFYFSAYPLKAISGSAAQTKDTGSPYLKAILSGKPKLARGARVFPMINPYTNQSRPAPFAEGKLPKNIELVEKEWFNNYE